MESIISSLLSSYCLKYLIYSFSYSSFFLACCFFSCILYNCFSFLCFSYKKSLKLYPKYECYNNWITLIRREGNNDLWIDFEWNSSELIGGLSIRFGEVQHLLIQYHSSMNSFGWGHVGISDYMQRRERILAFVHFILIIII